MMPAGFRCASGRGCHFLSALLLSTSKKKNIHEKPWHEKYRHFSVHVVTGGAAFATPTQRTTSPTVVIAVGAVNGIRRRGPAGVGAGGCSARREFTAGARQRAVQLRESRVL